MWWPIVQIQYIADSLTRLLGKVKITNGTYDADVDSGGGLKVTPPHLSSGTDSVTATVNMITGFALESGGNLDAIETDMDTLVGVDYATSAKQDTGNTSLGSIKTNTDPFVNAATGGYVRPTTASVFPMVDSQGTRAAVTFTSLTPADTANTVAISTYANVGVTLHYSGSVTGGLMYFEVSDDNSNWYLIDLCPIAQGNVVNNYTLASANGNMAWQMFVGAYTYFRVRVHTPVVGAGSAIVAIIPSTIAAEPAVALAGGTATLTNANLDVALSTLLKPGDTLTGVTTVGAVTAITNALPTGTNTIGNAKITDGTYTLGVTTVNQTVPANGIMAMLESASGKGLYPFGQTLNNTTLAASSIFNAPATYSVAMGYDGTNARFQSLLLPSAGFSVQGASAQTILSSAGVGKRNRIHTLTVSTDTAGLVTISDGIGLFYMAANSTVVVSYTNGKLQTSTATAITCTNGGGGNVACSGVYNIE